MSLVDGGALPDGSLLFPLTPYGSSSSASFQIQSISPADLHVMAFLFDGGDFSIRGDGGPMGLPLTLPASSTANFTVDFTPTLPTPLPSGPMFFETAGLIVQSDSRTQSDYPVPLSGSVAVPQIEICTTENGSRICLSQNPNLSITFPPGPVGASTSPARIDVSDLSDQPLVITGINLDAAALDAGFSIVETTLGLPRTLSATTGLTVTFHVALTPTRACANDGGCLTGVVTVDSSDPHYTATNPPGVQLLGTGDPVQSPLACIGIEKIKYVDGTTANLDPALALDKQDAGVLPPGPLDTATFTASPIPGCSGSPQNVPFASDFSLVAPSGSLAEFAATTVSGEGAVTFDLTGSYSAYVLVTELPDSGLAGGPNLLTADAGVSVAVGPPRGDLSVLLNWTSASPVEMDLHLIRVVVDGGSPPPAISFMVSPDNDCFWCNCYLTQNGACGLAYSRPTAVDWGRAGYQNTPPDDPLLTAYGYKEEYAAPLNAAMTSVGTLEPATEYDIYVHYYQTQNGADAGCPDGGGGKRPDGGDFECTDPDYPNCSLQECVPIVHAQIRVFVAGQEVGGSPNTADVAKICDLWHAGVLHWTSGGTLADGGFVTPSYVFVPTPGITSYYNPSNIPLPGTGTCTLPLQ